MWQFMQQANQKYGLNMKVKLFSSNIICASEATTAHITHVARVCNTQTSCHESQDLCWLLNTCSSSIIRIVREMITRYF